MTAVELANLVADMRRAQKEYFRTGSESSQQESMRLVRRLDVAIEVILRQPGLFDREEVQA